MGRSVIDVSPVKSADRTLDILELLATEPQGLKISEISARLGFAQSSTHGLVHTLESRRYLTLNGGHRLPPRARPLQPGRTAGDRLHPRSAPPHPPPWHHPPSAAHLSRSAP